MSKRNFDDYEDDIFEVSDENEVKKSSRKNNKKSSSNKNSSKSTNSSNVPKRRSNKNSKSGKKKPKRSAKAKFFMFLTGFLVVCCVAVTAAIVCFYLGVFEQPDSVQAETDKTDKKDGSIMDMIAPTLPERTTFLICGTDEDGTRTDTIMLGCYNSELEELTLMSVPRDTLVYVDDETYNKMNENFPEPGQHGMKINAIYHYGTSGDDEGRDLGLGMLRSYLEDVIGTDIDYTAIISFDAFQYLIDEIGGIEYNVPQRMYYSDPGQDLLIDLQPGLQTLTGEQAEGLVRFRSDYVNGDIGRVEVQQDFVKELIKQLANKDTILSKPIPFITAFFKYVETDISISDASKFVSVFKSFNPENVVTYTLPGDVGSLYDIPGGWVMNETETKELCNEIFSKPSSEIKAEREQAAQTDTDSSENTQFNDKELQIQVLNGSYTDGLATKTLTSLTSLGYNAMSAGNFAGDKTTNTRIFVKEDGMAQSLVDNFKDTEIIVDTDTIYTEKYDIVIVLGTDEQ